MEIIECLKISAVIAGGFFVFMMGWVAGFHMGATATFSDKEHPGDQADITGQV